MVNDDRIWNDLTNSVFYIEYLNLVIKKHSNFNRKIEIVLLTTSLISVGGWNKFAEYNILWTLLLLTVAAIRILKPRLLISEEELSSLKRVRNFYTEHYRDFETFWYQYRTSSINQRKAEKIFEDLNEKERLIMKIEKYNTLNLPKSMILEAKKLADKRLIKFTNNK